MKLLENEKFLGVAFCSVATYLFVPQASFSVTAVGALIGWQLVGFFQEKKFGDTKIYGDYKENGSFPEAIGLKSGSMRWSSYATIQNFLNESNKAKGFYLNNFRFSKVIKNKLNFINKKLANKAEEKGLFMKWTDLAKGSLIIGSMGAGKTEFLNNIIVQWLNNTNRKAVIHDTKGEFVKWFYNEDTDYIVNYLDKRGIYWNIFKDIENGLEIEIVYNFFSAFFTAKTGESKDKFWQSKAATRFKEIFEDILRSKGKDKLAILAFKLMKYLKEEKDDKTEQSVAATLEEAVEIFYYFAFMQTRGNKEFLITNFFEKDTNSKIFLHTISNSQEQNIPFLSAFLNVLFKYQLTYKNNADDSDLVLYVLDEYLTFFKNMSENLRNDLHTKARSYGILLLPAIQYLPDDKKIRKNLTGSIKNLFVFSISDVDTIEEVKRTIGKSKIVDIKKVNKIESDEKEIFIIDDNQVKNQKPGEHIVYIRDAGYLYKGYTKQAKVIDKNKEYIYANFAIDFIKFKKNLEEQALAENF